MAEQSKPAAKKSAAKPKRLGRGLSSLLSAENPVSVETKAPEPKPAKAAEAEAPAAPDANGLVRLSPGKIIPNKYQPRTSFDEQKIAGLAESIRRSGLMQPIVVRPAGSAYELVAGERRWRAASAAGVQQIPAIVRELSDQDAAEWALVENEQREDLNPVERARACRVLHESFGMNHADIGVRLGIDRSSVSNLIRLLELEASILTLLESGRLSLGHGKALLACEPGPSREALAQRAAKEQLSVRALEAASQSPGTEARTEPSRADRPEPRPELVDLQRQLESHLGSKVKLKTNQTGSKGRIEIPFESLEHFDSLMDRIGFRLSDG